MTVATIPPSKHPYPLIAGHGPEVIALRVLGHRWALPIIGIVGAKGPIRFVEIQRATVGPDGKGISTEQLRVVLNRLVQDGVLTRQRYREVPPRVDYALTQAGVDVGPILAALARWGNVHG